ncbi:MAG TPA: hypothetical protein VH682_20670 [Gemmataceae bacterium]|jgi:hypothetical protein
MESLVIVRPESPDHYVAQSLAVPEVQAVAATEAEAIEQVRESLTHLMASGKLVRIHVPVPDSRNPWLQGFGRSADDPDFEDYLKEIQQVRSEDVLE